MENKYKKGILIKGGTKVTNQTMVIGVGFKKGWSIGSDVLAFVDGHIQDFEHTGVYHINVDGGILIIELRKGIIIALNK